MTAIITGGAVALALAVAVWLGRRAWSRETGRLLARFRASRQPTQGPCPAAADLESLPAPVARYLKMVLGEGAAPGAAPPGWALLRQRGEMQMGKGPQGWRPFTATQNICARAPGFVWEATLSMAPGLGVQVRDCYVAGAGGMRGSILGLITVVNQQGTAQISAASLQRWLAEGPWLPTALLPDALVHWEAIDDARARAVLRDSAAANRASNEVSIEFRFNSAGEVESIFCPSRFRDVKGTPVATPWEGRFSDYRGFGGLRIPTRGEVGWHIDGEYQPYWRGEIEAASYS